MSPQARANVRNRTIVVNVTAEIDVDDLDLEDVGGITPDKTWVFEELVGYAEHRLDCSWHSMRFCDCGLASVLAQVREVLPG